MTAEIVVREELPAGRVFEVVVGDLLTEASDAIVNAANGQLAHGGGVAGAISRAAGPDLDRESEEIVRARGPIPVGEAVVTGAGRLPFKGVIHCVGPRLGDGDEEAKLARALRSAFLRADERGWRSVSFPAVSSGIFAVPPEVCVRAYLSAVRGFCAGDPGSRVERLRLVLLPGPILDRIRAEGSLGRSC